MRRTSGTFGPVFLKQNYNLDLYLLNRSIKLLIISYTIKLVSRKWRINVKNTCFIKRSNRGHQICFGVLSIMSCATAVNDFLGVLCATFSVSCSTKYSTMWTRNFVVSLLSSIDFQCYDHFVSYHVTTTFVSHYVL